MQYDKVKKISNILQNKFSKTQNRLRLQRVKMCFLFEWLQNYPLLSY